MRREIEGLVADLEENAREYHKLTGKPGGLSTHEEANRVVQLLEDSNAKIQALDSAISG